MIAHFALRLLCGMSLMWSLLPRRSISPGFFRIQMLVALGLSVLAALTTGQLAGAAGSQAAVLSRTAAVISCGILAFAAFIGSVSWTLQRRRSGDVAVYLIAGLSAATLLMLYVPFREAGAMLTTYFVLAEISSASMLGGATTGMLLGHWYLTAPGMSLMPFWRITAYFIAAAVVRLALSGIGLSLAWGEISQTTHWLWLGLRWSAGVAGPLLVGGMIWRILRFQNTQAATGVFFVGVILTFLGELSASLLAREVAMPL